MKSPYGKATVVSGPNIFGKPPFGTGRLNQLLDDAQIDYELQVGLSDAETAARARDAVRGGCGYLVCAGDDWTLHQVVNGIMESDGPINADLVLAVIPTPRGSDFLRTFGLSATAEDAAKRLASEPFFAIDIGRITWGEGEEPGYSYFVNMAQAGMWGEVVRRHGPILRRLGRAGQLLAFWGALGRFEPTKGAIRADARTYGGPVCNVVVANGQFYRDGIRLAVKAHPGDGKFDVLVQKGDKKDYLETMSKSLKGEHLPSPRIKEFMGARAEVVTDRRLPVEVDGRLAGYTPAIFEIVPSACRLKI